jgi:tripartite ATP-independent transporter DctP family solute receptor
LIAIRPFIRLAAAASIGALTLLPSAYAQEFKMRLAHELPLDGPLHRSLEAFAADVAQATDGRVEITIFGGATLGGDRALSEQVRLGGIQLANLGVATQAPLSPQFSIEEVPYAWESLEQIQTAFQGKLGEIVSAKMLELGARPLSIHPFGFRHLTNSVRAVRTPEDIKGLKLRIAEVPIRLDTFQLLETQPVPIAFAEVFTALQQGTVDGQENPLAIIAGARFFEVQKHLSMTGHIANMNWLVINEAYFASLPEDVQAALSAEAAKIGPRLLTEIDALETKLLEELKASGMEVVEDVDKDAFRKALAPVYEKYSTVFEPELWAALEESSSVSK